MPDHSPPGSIAVVIPLFNKAPHVERAIESVLRQTLAPEEIIVVDDGSTDGSDDLVKQMRIDKLRLLRRSPPGPGGSAARNLGITSSRSEWIALLDADDEWLPDHLLQVRHTLAARNGDGDAVAVFSGYENVYPTGRKSLDPFTKQLTSSTPGAYDFSALTSLWLHLNASPIWTSASVFRRDALVSAGMFPIERCSRGVDKDTWLRVAYLGKCLPTKVVTAIYHRDSVNMVTRQNFANRVPCVQRSIVELLDRVDSKDRDILKGLANIEMFNYALATTKVETLKRSTWSAFFSEVDPGRRVLLELLSLAPVSAVLRWGFRLMKSMKAKSPRTVPGS
jgi:glycosyltransferase involved in cell wall biosynthesis